MHPYRLDIKPYLQPGENCIEVRVRNLLVNCAIDPRYPEPPEEKMIIGEWPYHTTKLNAEIKERVYNWREKNMIKEPFASGLWGKITLFITK